MFDEVAYGATVPTLLNLSLDQSFAKMIHGSKHIGKENLSKFVNYKSSKDCKSHQI